MNISIAYLNKDSFNIAEHHHNIVYISTIAQKMHTIVVNVKYLGQEIIYQYVC